jgi:hypothetical protein
MNLDQYLASVQAESESQTQTQTEQPATTETTAPAPAETQSTETTSPESTPVVEKLVVDGEEYTPDKIQELKRGNLRNEDYTRKTQALADQRRELEAQLARVQSPTAPNVQPNIPQSSNPALEDLQNRVYDLMVEKEVAELTAKYPDFDAREALEIATSKRASNLEDAYLIGKAHRSTTAPTPAAQPTTQETVDRAQLEADIRKQVLAEIEATRTSTQTIISPNDSSSVTHESRPKLSQAEEEFCRKSGMDSEEYVKWRDMK